MAKKKFSFYPERTAAEKSSHLTFDLQNHQRGWSQREVDYLTEAAATTEGRVSYSHEEKPYKAEKVKEETAVKK